MCRYLAINFDQVGVIILRRRFLIRYYLINVYNEKMARQMMFENAYSNNLGSVRNLGAVCYPYTKNSRLGLTVTNEKKVW